MKNREIYPNAPVVLTAFEVRHTISQKITPSAERKIKGILGSDIPLRGQIQPPFMPGMKPEIAPRFTSRDRTLAVTFYAQSLVIETTNYGEWDGFRDVIFRALSALEATEPVEGVERVGLRYIDEIRVPLGDANAESINWAKWVDTSLLGPAAAGISVGLKPVTIQGLASFDFGEDKTLNVRFGNLEGVAVNPSGDLKRPTPSVGPYFLFDIDSFWEPSGEIQAPEVGALLKVADELHVPVRELFETLVTEDLRNEVLRNA